MVIGGRLGPYEVLSKLGEGGMGEVYRARDTKLNRDVALKVLPESVAADTDRLARFRREAQVLAALNHPNIAAIYGFEDSGATHALVMELVEGPTLADRIASGPLALDEALPIAKQVAEALEAAHEQGIIHRDLKPANIKVRPDGTVKVLDFGLAKALESHAGAEAPAYVPRSQAPTLTSPALLTGAGMILGTAAYMSPEQARGKPVDTRADIWAFGCVLYEMLTGHRPFNGDDLTLTLSKVLQRDPDWTLLPSALPASVRTYLKRCLEKDPRQRVQAIGDIRLALAGAFDDDAQPFVTPASTHSKGRRVAYVAAGALVGAAVAALVAFTMPRTPSAALVTRLKIPTGGASALSVQGNDHDLVLTPDGSGIVYRGGGQLFVRPLNDLEPRPIRSASAPRSAIVSPDGQWIAFVEDQALKKVSINGGAPITLCQIDGAPRGMTWGTDDSIVFATQDSATGLLRVSANGGQPETLTTPDSRGDHFWPQALPGNRGILFTVWTAGATVNYAAVLNRQTGTWATVLDGATDARYVGSGHLIYGVGSTLMAVRFNLAAQKTQGAQVPVVEKVMQGTNGELNLTTAGNGTMAYLPALSAAERTLVWVDRNRAETPIPAPARAYTQARVAPDGGRIALDVRDDSNDLWILDIGRSAMTRLTLDAGLEDNPVWTPDGTRLFYRSVDSGGISIKMVRADGAGNADVIVPPSNSAKFPKTVSPDGSALVFGSTNNTILVPLKKLADAAPLLGSKFNENNTDFSPDGRWIAYQSDESGRLEVYVRPYPSVQSGKWQVSTTGGSRPVWNRNGKELFFLDADNILSSVAVTGGGSFSAGTPHKLVASSYYVGPARAYDVMPDGQRFVMIAERGASAGPAAPEIVVVQNWFEELKHLVPMK